MDAGTLHAEIAKVCPIVSAKCEDANNRATWSFVPGEGATQPEIDAGNNVIATIPVDQEPPLSPPVAALYDHEARIAALESAPVMDVQTYLKNRKLR